jgi:bifunctional ADP-heptose synthase (sugar kinase/adenylyltransferase)
MRVLVIGDYIEDQYVFGNATRLCPEAPVPIIVPYESRVSPGGAGLVADQLRELLDIPSGVAIARYFSHSTKMRYFAGNHLVCRIDQDCDAEIFEATLPIEPSLEYAEAIVVCDYSKGGLTEELARKIVATGKPCFVDAKNHWQWYAGNNVTVFPNNFEAKPVHPSYVAADVLNKVVMEYLYGRVVSKMGKDGCRLNDAENKDLVIPATTSEIVDVTGAGDIFMAGFVYAWSLRLPAADCLKFANILAGESCRYLGTHVVSREFAEAVLGKILNVPVFVPPDFESSRDSTTSEPRQWHERVPFYSSPSTDQAIDIPLGGSDPEPAARAVVDCSPLVEQIHPKSPSSPTASNDAQPQAGQRIDCEPSTSPPWEG